VIAYSDCAAQRAWRQNLGEPEPDAEQTENLPELPVIGCEARGIRLLSFDLVFVRPLVGMVGKILLPFRFRGHGGTLIE